MLAVEVVMVSLPTLRDAHPRAERHPARSPGSRCTRRWCSSEQRVDDGQEGLTMQLIPVVDTNRHSGWSVVFTEVRPLMPTCACTGRR